jgi:hypothetical protein
LLRLVKVRFLFEKSSEIGAVFWLVALNHLGFWILWSQGHVSSMEFADMHHVIGFPPLYRLPCDPVAGLEVVKHAPKIEKWLMRLGRNCIFSI